MFIECKFFWRNMYRTHCTEISTLFSTCLAVANWERNGGSLCACVGWSLWLGWPAAAAAEISTLAAASSTDLLPDPINQSLPQDFILLHRRRIYDQCVSFLNYEFMDPKIPPSLKREDLSMGFYSRKITVLFSRRKGRWEEKVTSV